LHVQQLFFALVLPQIREKVINRTNRLSITKGCKTLDIEIQIQVPTAVSIGPTHLSVYKSFFNLLQIEWR